MTAASGSAVPGLYRGLLSASKSTWVRVLIPALRPVRGRFQDAHSGTLCEHRRLLSVCSIPRGLRLRNYPNLRCRDDRMEAAVAVEVEKPAEMAMVASWRSDKLNKQLRGSKRDKLRGNERQAPRGRERQAPKE